MLFLLLNLLCDVKSDYKTCDLLLNKAGRQSICKALNTLPLLETVYYHDLIVFRYLCPCDSERLWMQVRNTDTGKKPGLIRSEQ